MPGRRARIRRKAAAWRAKNAARARAYDRGRGYRPPDDPAKRVARNAVNNAVRDGRLIRPETCETPGCKKKPQAHHGDYSRPLEVRWLCTACHGLEHRQDAALAEAA